MAKQPETSAQSLEKNKDMVATVSPGLSQNLSKACAGLNLKRFFWLKP